MSTHATEFVQPKHIRPPAVRTYLRERGLWLSADFARLKTTACLPGQEASYHIHSRDFVVEADLATVWNTYLTIPPHETWRGRIIDFGCLYCQKNNSITYIKDDYQGLREGQVVFLNISLGWGLVNIAVAHKVVRIDARHKYIELSYIEGGKTQGSQRILFERTATGHTRIVHCTTYRGSTRSYLREKALYPYLHGQVIAAFHRNVRHKVMAEAARIG